MLFADETIAVWAAVGTASAAILGAFFAGLGTILGMWIKSRQQTHADSVKDYQAMYLEAQRGRVEDRAAARKEVHDLRDEFNAAKLEWQKQMALADKTCDDKIEKLVGEITTMHQEILQHEREKGELKGDIRALQVQMRQQQAVTGTSPVASLPGVLVVNLRGVITEASQALTPFLGWVPAQLIGQSIEMLVPPRLLDRHRAGFRSAVATNFSAVDGSKVISTHALDRDGNEVPVSITLRPWAKELGEGFVTATVAHRAEDVKKVARRTDDAIPQLSPPEGKP